MEKLREGRSRGEGGSGLGMVGRGAMDGREEEGGL